VIIILYNINGNSINYIITLLRHGDDDNILTLNKVRHFIYLQRLNLTRLKKNHIHTRHIHVWVLVEIRNTIHLTNTNLAKF